MGCPACSGSDRREITPGYFRCETVIVDRVGGPGLTNPTAGPMVIEQRRICGHEYHDTPAVAPTGRKCACGRYAIGECRRCNEPVCGDHGALHDQHFLCATHWHEADAEGKERVEQARAAQEQANQAKFDEWAQRVRDQLAPYSIEERTVRVYGTFARRSSLGAWSGVNSTAVSALLGTSNGGGTWQVDPFVRWFLTAVTGRPEPAIRVGRRTLFGGVKQTIKEAWVLREALCGTYTVRDSSPSHYSLAIEPNGTLWWSGQAGWGHFGGEDKFNPNAMVSFAEILGFPSLEAPPTFQR